jgi:hypothetical protein
MFRGVIHSQEEEEEEKTLGGNIPPHIGTTHGTYRKRITRTSRILSRNPEMELVTAGVLVGFIFVAIFQGIDWNDVANAVANAVGLPSTSGGRKRTKKNRKSKSKSKRKQARRKSNRRRR